MCIPIELFREHVSQSSLQFSIPLIDFNDSPLSLEIPDSNTFVTNKIKMCQCKKSQTFSIFRTGKNDLMQSPIVSGINFSCFRIGLAMQILIHRSMFVAET